MTRLIDADKFKDEMRYVCDAGGWLEPVTKAVTEYVKKQIDAQPTVDAEPVRHGRWKCVSIGWYACSLCGFEPWYEGSISTLNYCPNCGAKMKKQEEAKAFMPQYLLKPCFAEEEEERTGEIDLIEIWKAQEEEQNEG